MADGTLKVGTITTSSGSGTITLGQSGETITIPTGATATGFPDNTPAFLVRLTGNQSVANTTTTILSFNREALDTDSDYDSTNYRFVPQVQGYYKIGVRITSQGTGAGQSLNIYKNGSTVTEYQVNAAASTTNSQINEALVFMNGSSDYVDARVYQSSGSSKDYYGADYNCQFYGFRVIGT